MEPFGWLEANLVEATNALRIFQDTFEFLGVDKHLEFVETHSISNRKGWFYHVVCSFNNNKWIEMGYNMV